MRRIAVLPFLSRPPTSPTVPPLPHVRVLRPPFRVAFAQR